MNSLFQNQVFCHAQVVKDKLLIWNLSGCSFKNKSTVVNKISPMTDSEDMQNFETKLSESMNTCRKVDDSLPLLVYIGFEKSTPFNSWFPSDLKKNCTSSD